MYKDELKQLSEGKQLRRSRMGVCLYQKDELFAKIVGLSDPKAFGSLTI